MEQNIAASLQEFLKDLEAEVPEIEASSVVAMEGFPIASALPNHIDEVRVAAMTASILNIGERTAVEFNKGELNQVIIKGADGYIISMAAGENAVLTVCTNQDARLGYLLLYMKRTAEKIANYLANQ
ncbi:MAG: roadblock/LC7 domain-containing protein [Candidatus Helarchaeota archaeon]